MEYKITINYKVNYGSTFAQENYIIAEDEISIENQICEIVGRLLLSHNNGIKVNQIKVNDTEWSY